MARLKIIQLTPGESPTLGQIAQGINQLGAHMSQEIDELRSSIVAEVKAIIDRHAGAIEAAQAAAATAEEARAAVSAELDSLKAEVEQVTADVAAEGDYGQTAEEPAPEEPVNPEQPTE